MAGDWIKLYRAMLDHPVMLDDRLCRIWVWCLLRANYGRARLRSGVVLEAGQFAVSIEKAAAALMLAKSSLWRALKRLEGKGMGLISLKTERRFTVVTVCNWSTYQTDNADTGTQLERNWNATGTQLEQREERKKNTEDSFAPSAESDWAIKIHEAAFAKLPFPTLFAEVCKAHRDKSPPSRAEPAWKVRATSEAEAGKILAGVVAWNKSRRFLCGIGVPTLANFLRERWYDNLPEIEEADANSDRRSGNGTGRTDPPQRGKVRSGESYEALVVDHGKTAPAQGASPDA